MSAKNNDRIILDVSYQPHIRTDVDTRRLMLDVIIGLLPAAAVGIWRFGVKAALLMLVSVASAVFFEWAYRKLMKKDCSIGDLSAVVTGLLLAMTLPPQAPLWLPVIGTAFAIIIVKQLYGGIGKNFLNPALAGRALLLSSYAMLMNGVTIDGVSTATPLSYMYLGQPLPEGMGIGSLFLGTVPGAIGEISALALLIGFAWLLIRKVISWRIPVAYMGTVALICLIFGHNGYSNFDWMLANLFSGGLMLAAIFMATDYSTSPVTLNGQLLFGFGCGALTVLIRYFGGFPEGASYAVLIMNLCTWAIDKGFRRPRFGMTRAEEKAEEKAKKEA